MPIAHARFGASGAARYIACPASIGRSAGVKDTGSVYARKGTANHAVGERCLKNGYRADRWIGWVIEVREGRPEVWHKPGTIEDDGEHFFEVDHDDAEAVQVYLDAVRSRVEPGDVLKVEQRFSLEAYGPPARMFGTADAVVHQIKRRHLVVGDYKNGRGVAVDAHDNSQGKFYALGALTEIVGPIDTVEVLIVQPNAPHPDGPVRSWMTTPLDLIEWSYDLFGAVEEAQGENPRASAGSHCKFCPAAGFCPDLAEQRLAEAQMDFADDPRGPDALTPEQIARILEQAGQIEDWIRAVRAHAQRTLEDGASLPGWKLVQKRPRSKYGWRNEGTAAERLLSLGLLSDEVYKKTLITVSQAEKKLGKSLKDEIADLRVENEASGYTLAPESDGRQAIDRAEEARGMFNDADD